ncbi:alpha/beta hydrolase [Nocardioides marmoribigeumensis]|uniref:S-formylglutathione hydrolase FrmB n=1 Tax=Nocardioides marmoribigeumensis TaxID=433649 RepID=A0ABU2BQK2_9ACTN|nr:alpha/beta hydrolase family protein [Nocardioides marmoribigeumensis]MDR7360920.1 S-formylglutathione hydrolase FrmB [Nocardioides marmoribigeumensis]
MRRPPSSATAVIVLTLLAAALALTGQPPARAVQSARPAWATSGQGLTVRSAERVDRRLVRLVVSTRALSQPVRVNVLLPRGYAGSGRRYPVLHLLHGTSGGADDWVRNGEVRRATARRDVIVVMPDGGYDSNGGGWWTDWVDQHTSLGAARWETFHVRQLVPWVDAHLRTVPRRGARAIAGLSQGGFGSFSYAARHPDLFVSAASFSGAPDIARAPAARTLGATIVGGIMTGLNHVQPNAPFGDPVSDAVVWRGHNPASLVTNLRHTDLRLWTGDGTNGPYDDPASDPSFATPDPIETMTHRSTLYFTEAATTDHVAYRLTDYGPGRHRWPYWARDLRQYLPSLTRVFAEHRGRPAVVGYRSIDRRYAQWGWSVRVDRTEVQRFSGLSRAGRGGFTFSGSRAATVRTARLYVPRRAYAVRVGSGRVRHLRADARGRLTVGVPARTGPVRVTVRR